LEVAAFGHYQLQELLGRGGMGEVWRAFDTSMNRVVALKVLPPHLAQDHNFVQRFRREAHAAAGLNSPHVIPIHRHGEIDGQLYLDMRLVEGRDLASVIADGPLEPARAAWIIEQVARALHAAHKVGLLHRDVKPSNILLDDDFAYLIDFGIARGVNETGLTGTGAMIGTWQYMAPERLTGRQVDARSDVYALACVLYETLTGLRPFPGNTLESQVGGHLSAPPPRPSTANPGIAAGFDDVIAAGMAKDPDDRYPSTMELASAARDALTALQPRTEIAPPPVFRAASDEQPLVSGVDPVAPTRHRVLDESAHSAPQPLSPHRPTVVASSRHSNAAQAILPFDALSRPYGVAVGVDGAVYVADFLRGRVLGLAAGATSAAALPFTGLNRPYGVGVGVDGAVYVTDFLKNRVLRLAARATSAVPLPFVGLSRPEGLAVDFDGAVYLVDSGNARVLKLEAGASAQVALPFTGLNSPESVAVGADGAVYVTDYGNNRVLRLAVGASTAVPLPFAHLTYPQGVAVGGDHAVYVTNPGDNQVLKLPPGAETPIELPFSGLNHPIGVAVGADGSTYVADQDGRVLKLAARSEP
jgi:serine/threonine protein kinase, bacterial